MRRERIKIEQIKENPDNPRVISDYMLDVLVKSIINLPPMLQVRPIVLSTDYKPIGGNQRVKALLRIAKMKAKDIQYVLEDAGKEKHLPFWKLFLKTHEVDVLVADDLSDLQLRQFVIKDNTYYGEDDVAKMRGLINEEQYQEWLGKDYIQLGDFDAPINDEEVEVRTERNHRLHFTSGRGGKVEMTEEEYKWLIGELQAYQLRQPDLSGFITYLLNGNRN